MEKVEIDGYWDAQISHIKRLGFLRQPLSRHQGYRQKLHAWKGGSVTLNAGFDDVSEWVHVDITMTGKFRASWYKRFEKQQSKLRSEVEKELEERGHLSNVEWIWDRREEKGESWIIIRRHGLDLTNKQSRDIGQRWVAIAAKAFWTHLGPLVETL